MAIEANQRVYFAAVRRRFPLFLPAVAASVGLIILMAPCFALPTEFWPYERLLAEADVVIIGQPMHTRGLRADEQQHVAIPAEYADHMEVVVTEFKVLGNVKDSQVKSIVLEHLAWTDKPPPGGGFPHLIRFRRKHEAIRGDGWAIDEQPEYMMFLKRLGDGRFTLIAGAEYMPKSVKRIIRPA